jgi:glutamate--cysteine ligase
MLNRSVDDDVLLKDYATQLISNIEAIAAKMGPEYQEAVSSQLQKVLDVSKTPSAKVIELAKEHGYKNWMLKNSQEISDEFRSIKLSKKTLDDLNKQAAESVVDELELRENDSISLNEYIESYYLSSKGGCG